VTLLGAQETITHAVSAWEGVTVQPHRYGGVEYVIGRREIGHIHGDHMVDIPFPKKVRDEIVQAERAQAHHILPESGWVSFYLRQPEDGQPRRTRQGLPGSIRRLQSTKYLVTDRWL